MEIKRYHIGHKVVNRSKFQDLRLKRQLFDFKIVTKGEEFDVHKVLIAIESDCFRAMLTNSSKEVLESRVELQEVDPDAMKLILDFIYTGDIDLTSENVESVLWAASFLQIQSLQDTCASFVEERVDYTNCLGILTLAERVNLKGLTATALACCLNNFRKVITEHEFLDLDVDVLKRILADDKLNVDDESDVIESIKKWLEADMENRSDHLFDLMRQVRFVYVDPVYLVRLNSYEPIKNSNQCRDLLTTAKDHIILKNNPEEQAAVACQLNTSPRISFERQRLYAVGGWTDQYRSIASAEVYNPNKDSWECIAPMTQKRCGVGLVTLKDSIYAVGGHDGANYLNSVERYDVVRQEWFKDVADMRHVRTSLGIASLNGHIYAIGGQISSGASDKVEKYDPASNRWTECAPLLKRRLGPGVATYKGHIYVMGGSDAATIHDSVEKYNPALNRWSFVADMSWPRKHLGSCCYVNKIYAVGGRGNEGELAVAEVYEPETNLWHSVKPMPTARCGMGLVELAGKIYAVGGSEKDTRLDLVEAYDPETNTWLTMAPMKACRLGGGMTAHPVAR